MPDGRAEQLRLDPLRGQNPLASRIEDIGCGRRLDADRFGRREGPLLWTRLESYGGSRTRRALRLRYCRRLARHWNGCHVDPDGLRHGGLDGSQTARHRGLWASTRDGFRIGHRHWMVRRRDERWLRFGFRERQNSAFDHDIGRTANHH
jgi:hypothetical protein